MNESNVRSSLVEATQTLINTEGPHTGINRILEVARVCKASLYDHFRSRDELVIAAITEAAAPLFSVITDIRKDELPEIDKIHAILNFLVSQAVAGHLGIKLPLRVLPLYEPEHPVHQTAVGILDQLRGHLRGSAEEIKLLQPEEFARQVVWLLTGFQSSTLPSDLPHLQNALAQGLESILSTELLFSRRMEIDAEHVFGSTADMD